MVKYPGSLNCPIKDLEENIDIESDCEGDSVGTGDGSSKEEEEEKEEKSRAVLTIGSFSACVRFPTPSSRRVK